MPLTPPSSGGGSSLPTGGTTDQVLAKTSGVDGEASWTDLLFTKLKDLGNAVITGFFQVTANSTVPDAAKVVVYSDPDGDTSFYPNYHVQVYRDAGNKTVDFEVGVKVDGTRVVEATCDEFRIGGSLLLNGIEQGGIPPGVVRTWRPSVNSPALSNDGNHNQYDTYMAIDSGEVVFSDDIMAINTSWNLSTPSLNAYQSVARSLTTGTLIATSTGGQIIRSTDNGATWTDVSSIGYASKVVRWGNGVFIGLSAVGLGALLRSTDDGLTWSVVAMDARTWRALAYSPELDVWVAGETTTGANVQYSTDGGLTWNTTGLVGWTTGICWTGSMFIAVGTSRRSKSTDGATWPGPGSADEAVTQTEGCAYGNGYVFSWESGGAYGHRRASVANLTAFASNLWEANDVWENITGGLPPNVISAVYNEATATWFAVGSDGDVYRSVNNAATWTSDADAPAELNNTTWIETTADGGLVLVSADGVHRAQYITPVPLSTHVDPKDNYVYDGSVWNKIG